MQKKKKTKTERERKIEEKTSYSNIYEGFVDLNGGLDINLANVSSGIRSGGVRSEMIGKTERKKLKEKKQ